MKAKIYTFKTCPYCSMAKKLLTQKGIIYDEIEISGDPQKLVELSGKTKMSTVPQIFIEGTFVGGYTDLAKLEKSGHLDQMISDHSD